MVSLARAPPAMAEPAICQTLTPILEKTVTPTGSILWTGPLTPTLLACEHLSCEDVNVRNKP